jgi:class 3 adenylate cyclase
MRSGTEQRRLVAIMFTDMVGYSTLTQRNEELALELLDEHRKKVEAVIRTSSSAPPAFTSDA